MNVALLCAWRMIRAKKTSGFISFMSWAAMMGIALGVMVLITVLSILNGFNQQIQRQFLHQMPAIEVIALHKQIDFHRLQLLCDLGDDAGWQVQPFLSSPVIFNRQGNWQGVRLMGVQDASLSKPFTVRLSSELANHFAVAPHDQITALLPKLTSSLVGVLPEIRQLTVASVDQQHALFSLSQQSAYVSLTTAERLLRGASYQWGLRISLDHPEQTEQLAAQLRQKVQGFATVITWVDQFGDFFKALDNEKTLFFFVLSLIVAIAVFNLVSGLMMCVFDKRHSFAIFRTLGASPTFICLVVVIQGMLLITAGLLLGTALGYLVTDHADAINQWVLHRLHFKLYDPKFFFGITHVPYLIEWEDVVRILAVTGILGLCATIYPAIIALRQQPAQVLRHE